MRGWYVAEVADCLGRRNLISFFLERQPRLVSLQYSLF